jgi:hypothetical protein
MRPAASRWQGLVHLGTERAHVPLAVGDPKEAGFGYCGSSVILGHPYCAEHVAIAFQAPNRKDKKPHKDIKIAETPELEDLEVEVEDDEEAEDETLADDLDDEDDTATPVVKI